MYFTALLLVLLVAAFWVMAGQYPGFKALEQPASLACLQEQLGNSTLPFGPAQLSRCARCACLLVLLSMEACTQLN